MFMRFLASSLECWICSNKQITSPDGTLETQVVEGCGQTFEKDKITSSYLHNCPIEMYEVGPLCLKAKGDKLMLS